MSNKAQSPFDYGRAILKKTPNFQYSDREYNPWMVNRVVSMAGPIECMLANFMNECPGVPKRLQFLFYWRTVRQDTRGYIQWVKGAKGEGTAKFVPAIVKVFEVRESIAAEYAEEMSKQELKYVADLAKIMKD